MADYREWLPATTPVNTEIIQEGVGKNRSLVLRRQQDVTPILDENSRLRQHKQYGSRIMGAKLAARVPAIVYWDWKKDWKMNHRDKWTWQTFLAMKLNSRDYSKFRVDEGKL